MKRNCDIDNLLVRDGVSQAQRMLPALDPDYIKVDERAIADWLGFAHRYAELVQYYDASNLPAGDWQSFIQNDVTTVIALMSQKDLSGARDCFEAILPFLETASSFDSRLKSALKVLFDLTFTLAHGINAWYAQTAPGLAARTTLQRMISAQLKDPLRVVIGHYRHAQDNSLIVDDPALVPEACQTELLTADSVLAQPFETVWIVQTTEEDLTWDTYLGSIAADGSIFVDAPTASRRLREIYEGFYNAQRQIIHEAPAFIQETLDQWPRHEPHMALFLTFLQLLQTAQNDLNTLTQRHLVFYYKRVLQFEAKPEVPDQVHVIFEPAKQVTTHLLKQGTLLKAGKDALGKEVQYQLDRDLTVNKAAVNQLKTVFIDRDDHHRVYAAPAANSKDGQGKALEAAEPRWKTLGESQRLGESSQFRPAEEWTMPAARIGFAVASPLLLLKEGTRTITITATTVEDPAPGIPLGPEAAKAFRAELSGEEDWITADLVNIENPVSNQIEFTVQLDATAGAIVAYNKKTLGGDYDTDAPLLVVTLDPDITSGRSYAYQPFKDIVITAVKLAVNVQGVQDLIVQNDLGMLDASKPIQPFGPQPVVGSRFYIGSNEIFRKHVTRLTICYEWLDAPADFAEHYVVYDPSRTTFRTSAFTAELQVLRARQWDRLASFALFTSTVPAAACDHQGVTVAATAPSPITRMAPALEPITRFDHSLQQGFMRWELTGPPPGFGHQMYANVYARQVIALTKFEPSSNAAKRSLTEIVDGEKIPAEPGQAPALPSEPYTPVIKNISVNYAAEVNLLLDSDSASSPGEDKFYHIYPFGYGEVSGETEAVVHLLPQFVYTNGGTSQENEGQLYIGLTDLTPPQNLALLFQVAEGSADPELAKQEINWSFLSQNRWQDFKPNEIVADSTNGLLTSGIITFDVPPSADKHNTLLPSGMHWLRASVTQNSAAVCDLIDVRAQAAPASFVNQKNDPNFLAASLPPDQIKKLQLKQAEIKSVSQPYASFGGAPPEQSHQFYTRVSERLRHKGRGISIEDYEKLVLEKFPVIYKVKCINHSTYNYTDEVYDLEIQRSEFAPGFATVIVIPDLNNKNAVDPLEPRASLNTLEEIKKFLSTRVSPFAARTLRVINPLYEQVQVVFGAEFRSGFDRGYYETELNQDIIRFLSPWAYGQGQDIVFGGRIHKSVILNFVEEQAYVDYVTDFQMNHFIEGQEPRMNVDEALPTTARSILVSHRQNEIKPVENCP